jgi:hypothetical protein
MLFHILTIIWVYTSFALANITFEIKRVPNPNADQVDAYTRIEKAMRAAVTRYNKLAKRPKKTITVQYSPGVSTADGNFNGNIRFGSNRSFMDERAALHEIAHTLGVGQTQSFNARCSANNWPTASKLLQSWDGPNAKINCGGGHFWPYGLNYGKEWSETNANRHCQMLDAMLADGLAK